MEFGDFLMGIAAGFLITIIMIILIEPGITKTNAEFVCDSLGLELVDFEYSGSFFKEIKCSKFVQPKDGLILRGGLE